MKRRFKLTHDRAPGDVVVMTAMVRDLKLLMGDDVDICVKTSGKDLWRHNPYIDHHPAGSWEEFSLCYRRGIVQQKRETIHFLNEFHFNFKSKTGIHVPLTLPRPDLHLSDTERDVSPINGRYWVFLSGGKSDFTIKAWDQRAWTQTVELLGGYGIPMVQIGGTDKGHWHPQIPGTIDLVGQTNLRDMMRLIHHADGVICGVTCAMHMAAALEKPCVVIAGGREAWWWEAYVRENRGLIHPDLVRVPHRFLHTIGQLPCCAYYGCWKNKVVDLHGDKLLCVMPVVRPGQAVAKCMDMITPTHVVDAVMSYYTDSTLPPIREAKAIQLPPPVTRKSITFVDLDNIQANDTVVTPPVITVNPQVSLEGRHTTPPRVIRPGAVDDVFEHPTIGGKFTVFVLMYGGPEFTSMHQKCVDGIISTMPAGRMDLRIGSNQLCRESLAYVDGLVQSGTVSKHYRHQTNDKKYPVMREMFWDASHPITTKWLLWFDDDSIADRNRMWPYLLSQRITSTYDTGARMVGDLRIWELKTGQREMYMSRPWYKRRPFRDRSGRPAPNGNKIAFAAGGFWALEVEAMRAAGIPDELLGHNGGDYTIGEQLWQAGFTVASWNSQKQFIRTSSVPRRGVSETHFGMVKPTKPHIVT